MGQKGPPFISNPSSFRFVAGQSGNNSDKNRQNNGAETLEDDIDKDLDELSEEEWFQTGVDFVLS